MKIIACIRFCVDVAQLRVDGAGSAPSLDGVPWRISTLDEYALESAVQLKERHGGTVIAVSLAAQEPPRDLVLKVLAMGADEAHIVTDPTAGEADALATATVLARVIGGIEGVDLVVCGEGSSDQFNQQVGVRVAEGLWLPSVTYATRIEVEGYTLLAERLLEDRVETVCCELPALATVGQEAPAPRLPGVLQILGAAQKPVRVRRLAELVGMEGASCRLLAGTHTLEVRAPRTARKGVRVEGEGPDAIAAKLVRLLSADGAVRAP